MEDRETARMRKYAGSKTTRIMMATVPHVTSGLGIKKFQAHGFLLTRVYLTKSHFKNAPSQGVLASLRSCPSFSQPQNFALPSLKVYTFLRRKDFKNYNSCIVLRETGKLWRGKPACMPQGFVLFRLPTKRIHEITCQVTKQGRQLELL